MQTKDVRTNEIVNNGIQSPLKNPVIPSSRKTLAASLGTDIGLRDACKRDFSESSCQASRFSSVPSCNPLHSHHSSAQGTQQTWKCNLR